MSKPVKLYWDSCAWIGLINGEPDKKRELGIVYTHAKQGHYEIWTSTLSIVEVRRVENEVAAARPWSEENHKIIRDVFRQPCVKPIPLTIDISEHAREIYRASPGLQKWQDSIHIASALRWSVDIMHTYDKDDLIAFSQKFKCHNGENLTIIYPDETTDGPLFAKTANR